MLFPLLGLIAAVAAVGAKKREPARPDSASVKAARNRAAKAEREARAAKARAGKVTRAAERAKRRAERAKARAEARLARAKAQLAKKKKLPAPKAPTKKTRPLPRLELLSADEARRRAAVAAVAIHAHKRRVAGWDF